MNRGGRIGLQLLLLLPLPRRRTGLPLLLLLLPLLPRARVIQSGGGEELA